MVSSGTAAEFGRRAFIGDSQRDPRQRGVVGALSRRLVAFVLPGAPSGVIDRWRARQ